MVWCLAFCLIVAVLTGIISGASAAFQKRQINETLKESSGNITASGASKKLRQALLVVQFSLAFIVITSATLVSLSLYRLNNQDTGFDSNHLIALQMGPGLGAFTLKQWHDFAQQVTDKLEEKPEISKVAYSTTFPMTEGRRPLSFFSNRRSTAH